MKFLLLTALLFAAACATLESQSDFLSGRRALLRGEPDNALSSFDRVARGNPSFVADYVAKLYLGLTLLRPSPPRTPSKAFSLQEVTYALREGVEPKRVATLARERGVAFDLTKETESQLQTVGADNLLLTELRSIRAQSAKQNPTGETQRVQAGKELTTALTGLRDWLDYTVAYTPQGKFWDPSEQIRRQIALSLKLLAAKPTDWEALISNAESVGSMLEDENDRARRDESAERERQMRR
jgi:hypothetical protein